MIAHRRPWTSATARSECNRRRTRRSGGRKSWKKNCRHRHSDRVPAGIRHRRRSHHRLKWSRRTTDKIALALGDFGHRQSTPSLVYSIRWAIPCASITRNFPPTSARIAMISSSTSVIFGAAFSAAVCLSLASTPKNANWSATSRRRLALGSICSLGQRPRLPLRLHRHRHSLRYL